MQPPLQRFLTECHSRFADDHSGAVADYIPELSKADPALFGIGLCTTDGYVYEAGDSAVPFTIQSISKAFVFALALETRGAEAVESKIGVEPSGEAFNSIRLTADNKPFNPMVNAGAIACSGLIREAAGADSFDLIQSTLGRFAGRTLDVDEAVYHSESATGHRNRAIAWMLHNHGVVKADVDGVLDIYFRQCAVLVTARDIAVMAATLANSGINPVTGEAVVSPYAAARTLSVMTSSGMYDYAGEWIYRVGIPAKSGVGGGIAAALPAQLGLGVFSPPLDDHGNTVRGLKVCEALSSHFNLHVLSRTDDVRSCVIADYDIASVTSRRSRQPQERQIILENHSETRVVELVGALTFATIEYVSRRVTTGLTPDQLVILDFRRVPMITAAGARLLGEVLGDLIAAGATPILAGLSDTSPVYQTLAPRLADISRLRKFPALDDAVEWAEDQVIYRYGGFVRVNDPTPLDAQALLTGMSPEEIAELSSIAFVRQYAAGERIIRAGDPSESVFFLQSGMVSVKLPSGVRLASMVPGMEFGEMALLGSPRSADVWADTAVQCLELPLSGYDLLRQQRPQAGEQIMRNLAALLARRLLQTNAKVDLLRNS